MKRLTIEGLPRLRDIGREFTAAAGLPAPFNPQHFELVWTGFLNMNIGTIFYEENNDGIILGVLAAVFSPDMFSGRLAGTETFFFVLPEARGQHLSVRLLDAFEDEAKLRGCKQILMVSLAALEVGSIYGRRGYKTLETIYSKEI